MKIKLHTFLLVLCFSFNSFLASNGEDKTTNDSKFMADNNIIVTIQTNQGDIKVKLFPDITPKTCENFIGLAEQGYYNGVSFHRVISGFMIQGGDPTGTGAGGDSIWGQSFSDEVSPDVQFNKPGLLAMANAGPNTNRSQFFITTAKTPWLNMRHTIFGEVIEGYDIVQKIEKTKTNSQDRPLETQKILAISIEAAVQN